MGRQRERESLAQGDLWQGRQRDASRSACGVDRKHKIQKVLVGCCANHSVSIDLTHVARFTSVTTSRAREARETY